jgi:peptidoglycan hydrolase-like amidase
MALAGKSYREILAWYYTGATVGTSTGVVESR